MKVGNKEISDLTDAEVIANFKNCVDAEEKRRQAGTHIKFNKANEKNVGSLPSANPVFLELKKELQAEIIKRKLEI